MTIAILSALLIHVIWLARTYTHIKPEFTKRCRAGCGVLSWILTTAIFCLVQLELSELNASGRFFLLENTQQIPRMRLACLPSNTGCYAETIPVDNLNEK